MPQAWCLVFACFWQESRYSWAEDPSLMSPLNTFPSPDPSPQSLTINLPLCLLCMESAQSYWSPSCKSTEWSLPLTSEAAICLHSGPLTLSAFSTSLGLDRGRWGAGGASSGPVASCRWLALLLPNLLLPLGDQVPCSKCQHGAHPYLCLQICKQTSLLCPFRIILFKMAVKEVAQSCPTLCDPMDCRWKVRVRIGREFIVGLYVCIYVACMLSHVNSLQPYRL